MLRVTKGDPTEEEVAALVVALLAATSISASGPTPSASASAWASPARALGVGVRGPHAWRLSGRA